MANPKDTPKNQPPERTAGSDPGKLLERGAQEQGPGSTPESKLIESQPNPVAASQQASPEDKARIRELEQRLLEQSERYQRRQEQTEAQLAEFRKMLEMAGPALARAVQPPAEPEDKDDGKISIINQRNAPVTLHTPAGGLRLAPGSNVIDGAAWAQAKKHPQVKRLLEIGTNPFSKEGLREAETTTKSMDLTNALLLVQATTSIESLERALAGEDRREVTQAADAQAKRIRTVEERVRGGG